MKVNKEGWKGLRGHVRVVQGECGIAGDAVRKLGPNQWVLRVCYQSIVSSRFPAPSHKVIRDVNIYQVIQRKRH